MNFLQEQFRKTGFKQCFIAEKLDITDKTMTNWLGLKGIDFSIKFLEFLNICGMHQCDFLNLYHETDKFSCEYCKDKKRT